MTVPGHSTYRGSQNIVTTIAVAALIERRYRKRCHYTLRSSVETPTAKARKCWTSHDNVQPIRWRLFIM